MSAEGAAIFVHDLAEHDSIPYRHGSTGQTPSPLAFAALRAIDRGARVIYVAGQDWMEGLDLDTWLSMVVPPTDRWKMLPMADIARAARRALPDLLRDPDDYPPVIGAMCLPVGVVERLLMHDNPRPCLLLDGVNGVGPDMDLALESIRVLCLRNRVEFHAFP